MESIRLYRAVSLSELSDLLNSGSFRSIPGSLEGKWFADSSDNAQAWGLRLFKGDRFRVVSVTVTPDVAASFFCLERLDNIGPARFAQVDQLSSLGIIQVLDE